MSEMVEPSTAPEAQRSGAARAVRVAGLAAAALCAAVAIRRADLAGVGRSLAGADAALLLLASAANVASLAAHACRWRAVVRAPGVRVRLRDTFAALVGGFAAGIVLPARGGDIVRAHLLSRRAGVSTWSLLVASGLDYVVGTAALVVLLGALGAAAPLPQWVAHSLSLIAAIAAVAAAAAWLLRPRATPAAHEAGGFVARLRAGLAAVREPRALVAATGWAMVGWAAEVTIALATLRALDLPSTPVAAALVVLAASAAAAIPLAPGNAGSFELATAIVVGGLGAERDAALAFAVAFHLVHLVPVALVGGAVLVREAVRGERRARA